MERTITATELAQNLSDVLNRIRERGEWFVVERDGEPVATLGPVGARTGITLRELLTQLDELPRPDENFASDIESIRAAIPPVSLPE